MPHIFIQRQETVASGGRIAECPPPFLVFRRRFTVVEPIRVIFIPVGCVVALGPLKVTFLDPALFGSGTEGVVVGGEQNGVDFVEYTVRNLMP